VATSGDGLDFHGLTSLRGDGHGLRPVLLGRPYVRVFWLRDRLYAVHVDGRFALADGIDRERWHADPEVAWTPPPGHDPATWLWRHVEGPLHRWYAARNGCRSGEKALGRPRHLAVAVDGDRLELFSSNYGDRPERIVRAILDTAAGPEPDDWRLVATHQELLRPEQAWEGSGILEPDGGIAPSVEGPAIGVNQLRDPAILDTDGRRFLFYSGRGEEAIGGVELLAED
jgi:hypothetical protein